MNSRVVVTVHTTPGCVQCRMTERALDRRGIDYVVVDLSVDEAALARVRELGHATAPVVVVTDTASGRVADHWAGFKPERIAALPSRAVAA